MSYSNNEQLAIKENSHHSIFHVKNSLSFSLSLFFSVGRIIVMANQIDGVMSTIDGTSVDVHIIEGDLYRWDQQKVFTFRIARISLRRGSKPAKIAR
jgi:hypothetical protein